MTSITGGFKVNNPEPQRTNGNQTTQKTQYRGHHIESKKSIEAKLEKGVYVPQNILKEYGISMNKFKSVKAATLESMGTGKAAAFGKVKPNTLENVTHPTPGATPRLFPKESLTRVLTGDVKPEWLIGLGKMTTSQLTDSEKNIPEEQKQRHNIVGDKKLNPAEGYADSFVSSLEEYENKGIHFDPNQKNSSIDMAKKLALLDNDLKKVEDNGAWLVLVDPSVPVAVPSERLSEWNEHFIEGGYTKDGNREWVTPNIPIDVEVRSGRVKIFKMDPEGNTVQWKMFQGKLLPDSPNGSDGKPPVGSWNHAIQSHTSNVAGKVMPINAKGKTMPAPPPTNLE